MKFFITIIVILLLSNSMSKAEETKDWLKMEIDNILNAYSNDTLSNKEKFSLVENAINNNFAGAGIAKFVAGHAWPISSKETKKKFIKIFKQHLALNIASLMQGYSNQKYILKNTKYDNKNKVTLIDMEIIHDT